MMDDNDWILSLVGGPAQRVQVATMNEQTIENYDDDHDHDDDGHDHDDIGWGTRAESSGGIEWMQWMNVATIFKIKKWLLIVKV